MKKPLFLFIVVLMLSFTPAANAQTTEDLQRVALLQQINSLLEQVKELQQQLAVRQQTSLQSLILPPSAIIETRYRVYDASDFSWVNTTADAELMNRFVALSPNEFDSSLDEFVFFKNENSGIDAFVETLGDADSWRVGFNSELKKFPINENQTTDLLIHEIGHLVSLKEVNGDTLLKQFEKEFWNDKRNTYTFVSDYAKQNVAEDFAESFLEFVTNNRKYKGVAAQKIDFFSRYEIVNSYRTEIRLNI